MRLNTTNKIILNAVLVAGIVFVSTMQTTYPPNTQTVYAAVTGFLLALLTQLKTLTNADGTSRPPKFGMII